MFPITAVAPGTLPGTRGTWASGALLMLDAICGRSHQP